jgi:hypothetical protein
MGSLILFLGVTKKITFPRSYYSQQYYVIDTFARDSIIRFDGKPADGFNYAYYILIPAGTPKSQGLYLLVETNNTGGNDTLTVHDAGAKSEVQGHSLGCWIAKRLKIPFLVPVFPRPFTNWKIYTHALDRDAAEIKDGAMKRLDLQLIALVDDARKQLKNFEIGINDKFLMNGFSASGTFANRFTLIHPDKVKAVSCGGINAIPILPVNTLKGKALNYPLGTNDFKKLFSMELARDEFKKVPQFIYMGEKDANDAVLFDDGYSKKERETVFSIIGKKMMPDRWNKCREVYKAAGINATFITYEGIGHETNRKVNTEIVEFFKEVILKN